MTGLELVQKVRNAKKNFVGISPRKFSGAAAVEILREALNAEQIFSSTRDVFIRGIDIEIDLVIPREHAKPELGLIYEPQCVAIALEVKKTGSFGEASVTKIKNDFKRLKSAGIECAYVTFEEGRNYKWAATKEGIGGFECFTLAWHEKSDGPLEPTEDWNRLLIFLRERSHCESCR